MDKDVNYDQLSRLADLNGVATFFWDWVGNQVQVSADTLLKTLKALGLPVTSDSGDEEIADAIRVTEDRPWLQTLPDALVCRKGDWRDFWVHVDDGQQVSVWFQLEDGSSGSLNQLDRPVPPREVEGTLRGRATFEVPGTLPLGYHRLFASVDGGPAVSAPLIVVPQRLDPTVLHGDKRFWGINAQAYSVMTRDSWGVGDAADLGDLVAVTAQKGADFVLVNPVHAVETVTPMENSPYRPVSRQWHNITYIRPEDIPEYSKLPDGCRDQIEDLRKTAQDPQALLLDREMSWAAKQQALKLIFDVPRSIRRQAAFDSFCLDGGAGLDNHALWSALTEEVGTTDLPPEYRDKNSEAVAQFAATHEAEIDFHKWCQWIASTQLQRPNRLARDLGMDVGVMADLAVGIHPEGSEAWAHPDIFAKDVYVGAPPDMYSQQGQTWAQPPYLPSALAASGYEPFRQVIKNALSLSGALRIDHILGLFRLWWLPAHGSPADGTYVYFDHEAMVGVLLLEAARADAILIGEDLGTVEPWVREYLAQRGILGTSVLWFEKDHEGWPLHPEQYRRDVLATVNTHDLPPTAGYLSGAQTTLRDKLGLLVDPVEDVRAQDAQEQERMKVRLTDHGLDSEDELMESLHRYVCRTPSRLVAAALVDAVGEARPQNLPGTEDEYPNWRVPLADGSGERVFLEDLIEDDRFDRLFQVMQEEIG